MKETIVVGLIVALCLAIIGGTITGSVYFAYNPKVCPAAEVHQGYAE